jgi:hypothetical protein
MTSQTPYRDGAVAANGEGPMTVAAGVREIVVPASEEALNAAIAEHRIEPDRIISVMLQSGQHLAVGDYEPKYRVIYRV